jgi:hypothetical protein
MQLAGYHGHVTGINRATHFLLDLASGIRDRESIGEPIPKRRRTNEQELPI